MKSASRRRNASIILNPTMADGDAIMDSPRKRVAYDPDQDPEEKRVLRQKYRILLKDEEGKARPLSRRHRRRRGVTRFSFFV